jgi:hypothetical protein
MFALQLRLSLINLLQLFSDPHLDDLYRYFQAGSVAAYEHISMIKLHYSLVDIMDECIQKLEEGAEKKRRPRPRTQILIPECKNRSTIMEPEVRRFAFVALDPFPVKNVAETASEDKGSFSSENGYDEEDEDEFERCWIQKAF